MARRKKRSAARWWTPGGLMNSAGGWSHTTTVMWILLVLGGLTAWATGVPRLQAYVSARPGPGELQVRFIDAPIWMNGDLEAQLVLTAQDCISADVLRHADLVAAREALHATGWFDSIDQIRRVGRATVDVSATFATPYAVVRDEDGDHLIDHNGRLLPRSVPIGHATQFTTILGAGLPRPQQVRAHWPGGDVTAALRLKRLIDNRPWAAQVKAIDVRRYQREQSLSLVTDNGYNIHWGSPPGDERPGEVPTERKLVYLDYPFENYGHIDGGYQGDLDITDPRGVFGR